MSEHSAHQVLQTRFCRKPNCEEQAVTGDRGRYANLCGEHLAEEKRKTNGTAPARPAAAPAPEDRSASYEARARGLVTVAKKVDQALAKAAKARDKCQPQLRKAQAAKSEAEQMVEQFRTAVRALAS